MQVKKKIIFIITKGDVGGAQKYVRDLNDGLDKNTFEARIVTGGNTAGIKHLSNALKPHILFLNDWLAVFETVRLFKRALPDIAHLNSSKAGVIGAVGGALYNLFFAPKDHRLKIIFTAHGWVFNPTNDLSPIARRFYILLHKISALLQDKIICVSEYDKKLALRYRVAPEKKLITIHNGIDASKLGLKGKDEARKEIVDKLSLPNDVLAEKWVGSLGRLTKEKDFGTFIGAASFIPEGLFFIIGDGALKEKLEGEIKNIGLARRFFIVKPTGTDSGFLKAFDVFVMSSIKEGLPYALLEAAAAALPIVATDAGGMPEVIKDGETGFIVPVQDARRLADAISKLLADRSAADGMGERAAESVRKNFSLERMARRTEDAYLHQK